MRKNPSLRTIIILGLIFLITYALAEGIRYGSAWGVVMAMISMAALGFSIYLYKKLSELNEEEEQQ